MPWMLLFIAIILEVFGTVLLKMADGFTRWLPATGAVAAYALSLVFCALAMRHIDVTVAYVVWAGVGTVALAVIGVALFHEHFSTAKAGLILVILAATVGLVLASPAGH